MPKSSIKKICMFLSKFFKEHQLDEENFEELQKIYKKSHPKLKKQKLGDLLKAVICDGSVSDSYFSTNIYPYIGISKEMNWGYSGCGPQVLALNILFLFTEGDGTFARKHYQSFVKDFLNVGKQTDDLEISVPQINTWIYLKKRKPAKVLRLIRKGEQFV